MDAECGKGAMGVFKDVELSGRIDVEVRRQIEGTGEGERFERGDAVQAPRGIDELLDELGFGESGGFVFIQEAAAVIFIGGGVLGGEDRRSGGQAVPESVHGRTLFAGVGARTGGVLGIFAVDDGAGGGVLEWSEYVV